MLIVSDKRYVPTTVNMIVLQGEDGLFYYMHRSLYDQCVLLYNTYSTRLDGAYKQLGFENMAAAPEPCHNFTDRTPEPIKILGPFLSLVTGCENLHSIEDMCGAITAMSMSINFSKLFRVPADVRSSIKFSLSVREEYKVQWDRFFMETPLLEQVSFSSTDISMPVTADIAEETAEDVYDSLLNMEVGDIFDEEGEEEVDSPDTEEETAEVEKKEEEAEKPKTGFGMLLNMV